ncbi:MAG: hypothetical protein R2690_18745 [Acidimicrobiales bacterium]
MNVDGMQDRTGMAPGQDKALNRRSLLKAVGLGALGLGAGAALGGRSDAVNALFGGGAASAGPTSCAPASRIGDIRVVSGNLFSFLGLGGPDVAKTSDGGSIVPADVGPTTPDRRSCRLGHQRRAGELGICGDHGWVMLTDAPAGVAIAQPGGGSPILTGLAGNGASWS